MRAAETADPGARLPVVALVGRPNVGKSTLFNRLTGTRDALVADVPGLTRDRQYGFASHHGRAFLVVDTGGLMPAAGDRIAALAEEQARLALREADTVLFLTDARSGLLPADQAIASDLRRSGRRVRVVVNKSEGLGPASAGEFFGLGLGEPRMISAEHGHGVAELMDEVAAGWPAEAGAAPAAAGARIAVVGRPNVGKSTLVNRLLGEDRVLTGDRPGTTRDAIAVPFRYGDRDYVLVDTAGIRRRARVEERIETLSVIKALQAVEQADVVIVVADAQGDIGGHDARLMGLVAERGRGMVLAVNKWDGLEGAARDAARERVDLKLPFLEFVPVHFVSALHGSGLGGLMRDVDAVFGATRRELKTPALTRVLEQAVQEHAPPAVVGRRIKLRYAHAGGRNPPVIVIHGNQTERLPLSYRRYLANRFREAFELRGLPLQLEFRTGANPYQRPVQSGRGAGKARPRGRRAPRR